MNYRVQQRGYSLMELVIVIAIVGIMATIAIPSLTSFVNQNRLNSVKTLLVNDINTARSEAIKSNTRVSICASNNTASDCAASADWAQNGWLVCPASGAGCNTAVSAIVVRAAVLNGIAITANSTNAITFRPIGSSLAAAQMNLSGKTGAQSGVVAVSATGYVTYRNN